RELFRILVLLLGTILLRNRARRGQGNWPGECRSAHAGDGGRDGVRRLADGPVGVPFRSAAGSGPRSGWGIAPWRGHDHARRVHFTTRHPAAVTVPYTTRRDPYLRWGRNSRRGG